MGRARLRRKWLAQSIQIPWKIGQRSPLTVSFLALRGRAWHFCQAIIAPARRHRLSQHSASLFRKLVSQMQRGSGKLQSTPTACSKCQPFPARATLHTALLTTEMPRCDEAGKCGDLCCLPLQGAGSPRLLPSSTIPLWSKEDFWSRSNSIERDRTRWSE